MDAEDRDGGRSGAAGEKAAAAAARGRGATAAACACTVVSEAPCRHDRPFVVGRARGGGDDSHDDSFHISSFLVVLPPIKPIEAHDCSQHKDGGSRVLFQQCPAQLCGASHFANCASPRSRPAAAAACAVRLQDVVQRRDSAWRQRAERGCAATIPQGSAEQRPAARGAPSRVTSAL
jgi:hypothetical protein